MNESHFDIVIVGAGIVGLTLANCLKNLSLKIAVIDNRPLDFTYDASTYDSRVSAITKASERIFDNLNVWQSISEQRVSPYTHMHVWDATGDGKIDFSCDELGMSHLGHIIENRVMSKSLHDHLQHSIIFIAPETLSSIEKEGDQHYLQTESGKKIYAKLFVAADGGRSWVREKLNIAVNTKDYQQQALVTTVKTEKSHCKTARQIFLPTGPLAFLPLDDEQTSSIVWSTTPHDAQRLSMLDESNFKQELQHAFVSRLGKIEAISQRHCFPLQMRHAKQYVKHNFVLMGDAAHTIHPLAGQGVNLGILDAAVLAELVTDAVEKNRAIHSSRLLRRYERWRKADAATMVATVGTFKHLFSNDNSLLQTVRNLGLNVADRVTPLKYMLARRAMGLTGDLPGLAR